MHIVEVAAEFAPFAKAGGLGEVVTGLSRELSHQGETVEVILPKYDFLPPNKHLQLLSVPHGKWDKIYGYPDDVPRFLSFCKTVVEHLKKVGKPIDILHLHDWHTAAIASLIRGEVEVKSVVLTIHNLEYQGKCGEADLKAVGIKNLKNYHGEDPKYPTSYNILKGGILDADCVTTVSPTYAKEILTPAFGFGLDPLLKKRSPIGILNGIDYHLWNPQIDPHLIMPFNTPAGKKGNREALAKEFGLKGDFWAGGITRLVMQKGPELFEAALHETIQAGGVFILLCSTPLPELRQHFEELKAKYKNHPQVLFRFEFDEVLAHRLYAALDFILIPSHFEPCGLTQMIGMAYGAIPIVHATGGLRDTVFDCEDPAIPAAKRNGFTFDKPTATSFLSAFKRATHLFRTNPTLTHSIQQRGMQTDFSWKFPAQEYLRLFKKLT